MEYFTYEQEVDVLHFLSENAVGGVLRKDITLNEETQIGTTVGVLNKMLDTTISRAKKIDFSDIERSRGDATNCKFYKNLKESIDILCDIDSTTHKIPGATVVKNSLNNLVNLKNNFMEAFRFHNALGTLLYNTMYYSLMEATAYLIAASIDYSIEGNKVEPRIYEVNCRDILLLDNLTKFNNLVADGSILELLKSTNDPKIVEEETMNESFDMGTVKLILDKVKGTLAAHPKLTKGLMITGGAIALVYLLTKIVPVIRLCIYGIYKIRHKIAEAAEMQARLIELNLKLYKENGGNDEKVIERLEKAIAFFRKIAEVFAVKSEKDNNDAKKEEKADNVDANDIAI